MNDQLTEAFEAVLQAADAVRNRSPQEDVDNLVDVASKKFIDYSLDQIDQCKESDITRSSFIYSSNQVAGFRLRWESSANIVRQLVGARSTFTIEENGKAKKSIPVSLRGFSDQRRDGEAIYRKLNEISEDGVEEAKSRAKEKEVRFSRKAYDEALFSPIILVSRLINSKIHYGKKEWEKQDKIDERNWSILDALAREEQDYVNRTYKRPYVVNVSDI